MFAAPFRIADRESCNRKNALGHGQQFCQLRGMVPNVTHRRTRQARCVGGQNETLHRKRAVDGGVEETVQVVVNVRVLANLA